MAYQLSSSFPLAPTVTAAPPGAPALDLAERPALPRSPAGDAVEQIAARPLFSESRRPYAAAACTGRGAAPEPTQPALPLELAGTFLTGTDQAALLLVRAERPTWLRKGQLIEGWQIEAIEQDRVQLRKDERHQVLQLRDDIAVSKTARPAAGRQASRTRRPRVRSAASRPPTDEETTAHGRGDDRVQPQKLRRHRGKPVLGTTSASTKVEGTASKGLLSRLLEVYCQGNASIASGRRLSSMTKPLTGALLVLILLGPLAGCAELDPRWAGPPRASRPPSETAAGRDAGADRAHRRAGAAPGARRGSPSRWSRWCSAAPARSWRHPARRCGPRSPPMPPARSP